MARPTIPSVTAGLVGGVANAALAVSLVATAGYPVVESTAETAAVAAVAFGFGFVPVLLSAHTRVLSPAVGVVVVVVGVAYTALTSPPAETLYELGATTSSLTRRFFPDTPGSGRSGSASSR